MYKYLRKIIAIILCIAIILNVNHIESLFGAVHREKVLGEELLAEQTEAGGTALDEDVTEEVTTTVIEEPSSDDVTDVSVETETTNAESVTSVGEDATTGADVNTETTQQEEVVTTKSSKSIKDSTKSTTANREDSISESVANSSSPESETVYEETESEASEDKYNVTDQLTNNLVDKQFGISKINLRNAPINPSNAPKEEIMNTADALKAINEGTMTYDRIIAEYNLMIMYEEDWTAFITMSHNSSLDGVYVYVLPDGNKIVNAQTWNLSTSLLSYNNNGTIEYGIGSSEYPFRGNMVIRGELTLKLQATLFNYLSSQATITPFDGLSDDYLLKLTYENNGSNRACAGLANHFIMEQDSYSYSYYTGLSVSGYIGYNNTVAVAGGLFAYVENGANRTSSTFCIDDDILPLGGINSVKGNIAGGILGDVAEGITVELSENSVLPQVVESRSVCAGGVVGKLEPGSAIKTASDVDAENMVVLRHHAGYKSSWTNSVTGTGSSGGLVGYVKDATVDVSYIKRYDSVSGSQNAGGLIGLVEYSAGNTSYYTKVTNFVLAAKYINQTASTTSTSYCVGGVIGKYMSDFSNVRTDNEFELEISNITSEATIEYNAGTVNKNFPELRSLYQGDYDYSSRYFNGGIVGGVYGNNVSIHDIEVTRESYKISQIWDYNNGSDGYLSAKAAAGIIGAAVGKNIELHDIKISMQRYNNEGGAVNSNGMTGKTTAGLIAKVGYFNNSTVSDKEIKIKVSDITIDSYFTWAYTGTYTNVASGGLFGDVNGTSIICLDGTIDLSGLTTITGDKSKGYYDMAGAYQRKGFVAGTNAGSLIFFEKDAVVTRPITKKDGVVWYNFGDETYSKSTLTSDVYACRDYTMDDIGNYGTVYQNINESGSTTQKVIDFSQPYGSEVTGTVTKNADGKYVIDSLADALRVSIAGHTYSTSTNYPKFGAKCFGDTENGTKITELLAADYVIAADLDLKDANINGFLRNENGTGYGFSGTMTGAVKDANDSSKKYTINMNFISRQYYGGLYPRIITSGAGSEGVKFENLIFDGYVCYQTSSTCANASIAGAGGGIAANATLDNSDFSKNKLTFKDMVVNTKIKGYWYSSWWDAGMYSYGGFVGNVGMTQRGTVDVNNCIISPEISHVHANYFVGGLIGRIYTANTNTDTAANVISVTDSTVSTKITAENSFVINGGARQHSRSAGLIAFVGNSYTNVSYTSYDNYMPGTVNSNTYVTMHVTDCIISETDIDLTKADASNMVVCGGLLGYAWIGAEAEINRITVNNSKIYSKGYVGGLVSFVTGKYKVIDITINSLEMVNKQTNQTTTYSSFIFGNAYYAYVIFDRGTYHIASANSVPSGYSNFDEIVGINMQIGNFNTLNSGLNESYSVGGILNIIDSTVSERSKFSNFDASDYASYQNQIVEGTNKYTRYHYDLFNEGSSSSTEDWVVKVNTNNGNTATISEPAQLMTLQVTFYATDTIRKYFTSYYDKTFYNNNYKGYVTIFNISDNLDMKGYSFYPFANMSNITVKSSVEGTKRTIKLYGAEISDIEKTLNTSGNSKAYRNNEGSSGASTNTQHYLMHASLCLGVSGSSSFSDLAFTGSIANNGIYTGALIGGVANGTLKFKNITLNNLSISNYKTGQDSTYRALLVSKIGTYNGTTATLDNIQTINYVTQLAPSLATPVATSLIGTVGFSTAENVRIYFKNMLVNSLESQNVFEYAAFIYDYEYTDNVEKNKCYGLYTFDYIDTVSKAAGATNYSDDPHNVTYGEELAGKLQYNDMKLDDVSAGDANPLKDYVIANAVDNYIRYVYKGRDIYVNPQSGNIDIGCGTYEDPYQIENSTQLMSLYCYLTGKDIYNNMLLAKGTDNTTSWRVSKIGGDGDGYECSYKVHNNVHEKVYFSDATNVTSKNEEFPSMEEMRVAYYQITDDIDLTDTNALDLNDKLLVEEFSGLGTNVCPFSGVIVGKEKADGTYPTITLPTPTNTYQQNYGLIQIMQGAVVKDLNIATNTAANNYINVTSSGGGVAAYIIGGDNIIDNVKVSVKLAAYTNGTGAANANTTTLGGYVGVMQNGSLILRNIYDKSVVAETEFVHRNTNNSVTVYKKADSELTAASDKLTNTSDYIGLLVGKVYDGYVLYDVSNAESGNEAALAEAGKVLTNNNNKVFAKTVFSVTDSAYSDYNALNLINGFDIVNGYLIDLAAVNDRAEVQMSSDGNLEVTVKNGEELEAIALALNSDSLSIDYDVNRKSLESHTLCGYDYTARSRKALYSDIGTDTVTDTDCSDRNIAREFDDGRKKNSSSVDGEDNSNIYLYPYLCYKYMNFTDGSVVDSAMNTDLSNLKLNYQEYIGKALKVSTSVTTVSGVNVTTVSYFKSKFNKGDDTVKDYTTTYRLYDRLATDPAYIYDLSGYGISFRGFGELYDYKTISGSYRSRSDFRANFDGNNQKVKINMDRTFDKTRDFATGMFNNLTYDVRAGKILDGDRTTTYSNNDTVSPLYIKNINIVDSRFINTYNTNSTNTGAVAGQVEGVWSFENIKITRTKENGASSVADDDKQLIQGKKYVGGLIGQINATKWSDNWDYLTKALKESSNRICIKNCSIEGADAEGDDPRVDVNILSNDSSTVAVGGLVGAIGNNVPGNYNTVFGDVEFDECIIKNADIKVGTTGAAGGYSGYIGFRSSIDTYNFRSSFGVITVTGDTTPDDSDVIVNLNNVKISNQVPNNTGYSSVEGNRSIGGIFGTAKVMSKLNGTDSINKSNESANYKWSNLKIENMTVQAIELLPCDAATANLTTRDYRNGAGGMIGYSRVLMLGLDNISIKDSSIGGKKGADGKYYSYSNYDTAGLIGRDMYGYYCGLYYNSNNNVTNNRNNYTLGDTTADNIKIQNTKIYSYSGYVGGYIGCLRHEISNFDTGDIDNCTIKTTTGNSGGLIGYLGAYQGSYDTWSGGVITVSGTRTTITNQTVRNTKILTSDISGECAGGIIGDEHSPESNNVGVISLGNIYVGEQCDIRGRIAGGGIIGRTADNSAYDTITTTGWLGVGAKYGKTGTEDDGNGGTVDVYGWTEDTEYNNITGRISGGVIGIDSLITARKLVYPIYIAKNRIYSYRNDSTSNEIASGGLVGYKRVNTANGTVYDDVTITHNVIMTSGSGNSTISNSSNDIGRVGGMYGVLYGDGGGSVSNYGIKLIDNSLGYYDVRSKTENKYESYDTDIADYQDNDLKLYYYNPSGTIETVKWAEADINEDNVGRYSLGIGTFIGYKYGSKQVNLLRPQVEYAKTTGSIPAVDVGNIYYYSQNSTAYKQYPYAYRDTCHIVYFDNSSVCDNLKDGEGNNTGIIDNSILGHATYGLGGETEYFFSNLKKTNIIPDVSDTDAIDSVIDKYLEVKNETIEDDGSLTADELAAKQKDKTYNFLMSDRLNIFLEQSSDGNIYLCGDGGDDDISYFKTTYNLMMEGEDTYNNVPLIVLDGQDASKLSDYAVMLLTNGGGTSSNITNWTDNFLTISYINAVVDSTGKIILNDGTYGTTDAVRTKASLASNSSSSDTTKKNKPFTGTGNLPYDEKVTVTDASGHTTPYYTITLLKYTYLITNASGDKKYETLYIPIFVKEKVTVRSVVRVLGGEDYSYDDAKAAAKTTQTVLNIAHGSTFTIFAEFTYDSIRKKATFENNIVEKTLIFDNGDQTYALPNGTQITMVDYFTGEAYYYVTDGTEADNVIKFSQFKSYDIDNQSSSDAYEEKPVGKDSKFYIKDNYKIVGKESDSNILSGTCAIERYYIFVEPPAGDTVDKSFDLSIDAKPKASLTDSTAMNGYYNMYLQEESINLYFVPAPQISFSSVTKNSSNAYSGTKEITFVNGAINQENNVDVWATVDLSFPSDVGGSSSKRYWEGKGNGNTIDSTNTGKYVDIALVLKNYETGEEVPWPEGTTIRFDGEEAWRPLTSSVIYLYKDSNDGNGRKFAFDDFSGDFTKGIRWYCATWKQIEPDAQGHAVEVEYSKIWISQDSRGYYYLNPTNTAEKIYIDEDNLVGEIDLDDPSIVSNFTHLQFDFSNADLDDYIGSSYTTSLQLYRATDFDYPAEEEIPEKLVNDTTLPIYDDDGRAVSYYKKGYTKYETEVEGSNSKGMGAAITVTDPMELGINIYSNSEQKDKETIGFSNKLDFTSVIRTKKDANRDIDINKFISKTYVITYRIQQKDTDGDYNTISWEDSPFSLKLGDDAQSGGSSGSNPVDSSSLTKMQVTKADGTTEWVYVEKRTFSKDTFTTGIDGIPYVTAWDMVLEVDTTKMTDNVQLSNYKINATYGSYSTDWDVTDDNGIAVPEPASDNDLEELLTDFFIFTIAKLKTDM